MIPEVYQDLNKEKYMANKMDLYEVHYLWKPPVGTSADIYKQYCSETICRTLGLEPSLAVRAVYEAKEHSRALVFTSFNIDKATSARNALLALKVDCSLIKNNIEQPSSQ